MSQENVEIVRRCFEAFNTGGMPAVAEFFDPQIAWETDPFVPEPGVYEGIDAVRSYLDGFMRAFGAWHMEVHDVIDLGDADVFPVLTIKGQPLGQTERETALFEWCQITTVREGKVVRIRSFLDRERGREAAGLSE